MRRIKLIGTTAYYHAMTRTVNGEILLDAKAKEILRRSLWRSAEFCEVRLLNYCIMDNHFHVLLRIDPPRHLTDTELIAKVKAFYDHPGDAQRRAEIIGSLQAGGEKGEQTRQLLLARMGDLSAYMKTVKQRFSRWYNRQNSRFGTLYADRFRSVLLEGGTGRALITVAAYIALNPIRAGISKRPENYRFSGYAEAMAGNEKALDGLIELTGNKDRHEALREFRLCLYGKGVIGKADGSGAAMLDSESASKVLRNGGIVSSLEGLRCRMRYFTDGVILGSEDFVADSIKRLDRQGLLSLSKYGPRPVKGAREWGSLSVLRQMRGSIYG